MHDEGLIETVNLGDDERGLTLTREGRALLDSHSMDREGEPLQAFYAGVSRERELDHDSNLYATYRQEEARLRDEHGGLEIQRVVLEQDLKREYQEFLQEHNRGRADSDGRPDRDELEYPRIDRSFGDILETGSGTAGPGHSRAVQRWLGRAGLQIRG